MTSPALRSTLADIAWRPAMTWMPASTASQRFARAISTPLATMTSRHLSLLVMCVIGAGALLSVVTTTDTIWWQLHFSQLGIYNNFSGHMFNGTLVVAGLIIVWFAVRVRHELASLEHWRPARFQRAALVILMASVGVSLGGAGAIPVNSNEFLHDRAASGIMLSFLGILIVALCEHKRMSKRLTLSTLAVIVTLGSAITLFILGIFNLAALEAVGFTMIFTWIGQFTVAVQRQRAEAAPSEARERPVHLPRMVASSARNQPFRANERGMRGVTAPRVREVPGASAEHQTQTHPIQRHPTQTHPVHRRRARRAGQRMHPIARRVAPPGALVLLRRGYKASEAPPKSEPSTRSDHQSPRLPAAAR